MPLHIPHRFPYTVNIVTLAGIIIARFDGRSAANDVVRDIGERMAKISHFNNRIEEPVFTFNDDAGSVFVVLLSAASGAVLVDSEEAESLAVDRELQLRRIQKQVEALDSAPTEA